MKVYAIFDKKVQQIDIMNDIYYIDLKGKRPHFHTKKGVCHQIVTIKEFEQWLGEFGFKKLHKTKLVNMGQVESVDFIDNKVTMPDGTVIPISRRNIAKIKRILMDGKL